MDQTIIDNFESLTIEDMTKHAGKWIAVVDRRVVASGDSFKEVYQVVKERYPNKRPLFGRLPERNYIVGSF